MTTNYPGSLDSFNNPLASDDLDSVAVPHHLQHSNANDAIEAIQAELGTDPSGSYSTVKDRLAAALVAANNLSDVANASSARSNLGLAIGTHVQAYSASLAAISALTSAANKLAYFTGSGTAALTDITSAGRALLDDASAAEQRTTLGLAAVAASGSAADITTGTMASARLGSGTANSSTFLRGDSTWVSIPGGGDMLGANNLSDVASASTARANLGLGTIATQAASSVSITGGAISGITDLALADGSTGASDASTARSNLGIGSLGTQTASSVSITGGSITGITDLAIADGGTGASDASTARSNLGLGTIATQSAASVSITGGSITAITDLAVADGGTGASTASAARTNLGVDAASVYAMSQTINAQTGTTYTLVAGDAGKLVTCSNASAITLTVPTNASVAFATGTRIDVAQLGAGQVTVAGSGVTFRYTPTLKLRAQYSSLTLIKIGTDEWLVAGDMAVS